MKKSIILILSFFLIACDGGDNVDGNSTRTGWYWVQTLEGNAAVNCYGIAGDNSGDIFITGGFTGVLNISGKSISSYGDQDIFIVKFNSSGAVEWLKQSGGTGTDCGYGIYVDNSGNSYVTGGFSQQAEFDSQNLISQGDMDVFVAKYNSGGELQWVRQSGGTGTDYGSKITLDNLNNIIIVGEFSNTALFSGAPIQALGGMDVFVMKYNSSGDLVWVKQAGGTSSDAVSGVASDNSGNCYFTGYFKGSANFGAHQIVSAGIWDMYVSKVDQNGNFLWVKKSSGSSTEGGNAIAVDGSGNCFVTGCIYGDVPFDNLDISSIGKADIFVAKYDANGIIQWVKRAGGFYEDVGHAIAVDGSGNCLVAGIFQDTCTISYDKLFSNGGYDVFITKISNSGDFISTIKAGGIEDDDCTGIFVDKSGFAYVCGTLKNSASFGNIDETGSGSVTGYFAKIKL